MSIRCSDIIHHFQHSSTYIYESIYTQAFIFLLLSWFVNFSPLLEAVNVPRRATIAWRRVFKGRVTKIEMERKFQQNKTTKIHEAHSSNSSFKTLAKKGKVPLEKRRTTLRLTLEGMRVCVYLRLVPKRQFPLERKIWGCLSII